MSTERELLQQYIELVERRDASTSDWDGHRERVRRCLDPERVMKLAAEAVVISALRAVERLEEEDRASLMGNKWEVKTEILRAASEAAFDRLKPLLVLAEQAQVMAEDPEGCGESVDHETFVASVAKAYEKVRFGS